MRHGSAHLTLLAAVFILTTALSLAKEDVIHRKSPASLLPPVVFPSTSPSNTTTPKATTPSLQNTTSSNITTAPPTPHNTTTANVTSAPPTPHNTTIIPTPGPTPKTNITVGNYTVRDGKNKKLCVMVQAEIQIYVNNSHTSGIYIIPGGEGGDGKCDKNTANLKITLKEGYVSMNFVKNDTSNEVFVSAVAINLTYAFKPGAFSKLDMKNDSVQLFTMTTGHSYSCKSESVFLGNGTYLQFTGNRMQGFNFTSNQFGPIDLCIADQPDYRVAIGVGVVLLILIIIVVVAYLLSRRRRTDGYQSL